MECLLLSQASRRSGCSLNTHRMDSIIQTLFPVYPIHVESVSAAVCLALPELFSKSLSGIDSMKRFILAKILQSNSALQQRFIVDAVLELVDVIY